MRSCPRCQLELEERANFCVACGTDVRDDLEEAYPANVPDPLVGQIVADRYRILELVGRGGMGVVYKVEHVRMGKLMAMKLLHGELATDRDVVKRFKTEAQAVSRLSHPNTVQVFDFGRSDGLMYLVMEYIDGVELARLVRREGALTFARTASLMVQVCASLAEAHELGIIHRDLKPENVLVRRSRDGVEVAKVLDFGLAKLREGEDRSETTHRGLLVGTPHYMSPEQIRGEHMDHRTDIYALGAMMYKLLSGAPPFKAATPVGVLTKHLTEDPPPFEDRCPELAIPAEAEHIVRRCLHKVPTERPGTVDEIRGELLELLAASGSVDLLPADSGLSARPSLPAKVSAARSDGSVRRGTPSSALKVGNRVIQISNRSDFDRFERSLRRQRVSSWVAALVVLLVAAGLVTYHASGLVAQPRAEEREPNDEPADAARLHPGHPMRGTLGRRISLSESDRDWYRVVNEGAARRVLRAELTGVPRMDVILQVFDRTLERPVAEANHGGPGEPEVVTGVAVDGLEYFLLVREVWVQGRPPTENVSDQYELRVELLDPATSEAEPNDVPIAATRLRPGLTMEGYVGWPGDRDVYCLEDARIQAEPLVELETPDDMELVLGPADDPDGPAAVAGSGSLALRVEGGSCVLVRAASAEASSPMTAYRIRVAETERTAAR